MAQIGTVVSEKIQFEFLYVHDLGPMSRHDLDLQYSHIFIYSISCMLLLILRTLAAIVSEKSTVFTFSYKKPIISIMSSDFHFLVPESFHTNLVKIDTVVSAKIQFEFLYVHYLGPRSRNDLDLQYSHMFIYSIRCLLLLTLRTLAAIVSEKSTVFTFSYKKAYVSKFDFAVK